MKKLKEKSAYTLAELLVVVAIISILTCIAVPAYVQYTEKAKQTVLLNTARQIKQALLICEIEYMTEGKLDESVYWKEEFLKSPNDPDSVLYPYVGSATGDCISYSVKWGEYDGEEYRIKGFRYETEDYIVQWNRGDEITITKK